MECITKGFFEVRSKSTLGGSSHPSKNDLTLAKDNYVEQHNENITPIFASGNLIERYLESITVQNNNLVLLPKYKTLLRRDHETLVDSVKLLSGGAAGADPLYSGSIGPGMLTGAIFGEFKKSPPSLAILEVIRFMSRNNTQGILVIVSNNLSNRLNFGSACQSAAQEGIKTLLVNVGEDVSGVAVSKTVGRKGLCGIKFLFKIAGAMSEEKKTLYEIFKAIEKLKGHSLGSINVQIRPDMMVIGPGCTGESEKLFFLWNSFDDWKENARLSFIVKQSLSHLFHMSSYFSLHVVKGDEIAMIVNNLGNLSTIYLNVIIKEILDQVEALGITVSRLYSGRYLNSNLAGFSISVLKVDDSILQLLDSPAKVSVWNENSSHVTTEPNVVLKLPTTPIITEDKKSVGPKFTKEDAANLLDVLPKVVETILNMEEYLNKLDNDHDFGTAVSKFANAIKKEIENKSLKTSSPYEFLDQMSYLAAYTMGGAAGGIFSILFSSAAQVFMAKSPTESVNIGMWVEAARAARDGLQRFTRVRPGDRTILDALEPFVESRIEHSVKGLSKRVSAAVRGAEGTTRTSRGSIRASLVEDTTETGWIKTMEVSARAPDPGALCLASVIRTIFTSLQVELSEAEVKAEEEETEATRKKDGKETRTSFKSKEEVKRGSKVTNIESKHVTKLTQWDSEYSTSLDEGELKHGTKLTIKESKHHTTLRKGESKHGMRLTKTGSKKSSILEEDEELMYASSLGEEEQRHGITLSKGESKYGRTLTKEGSKHVTALNKERSKHGRTLTKEGSKHGTALTKVASKHGTTLTKKGSKHGTKLSKEESKLSTELTKDESIHGTKLTKLESKVGTKLTKQESKQGTKFEEDNSKLVTQLKEEELKHVTELKKNESSEKERKTKLETHREESQNLKEAPSNLSSHSQSLKQGHSEEVEQIKEVVDEIAQEIEDEVPHEN